MVPGTKVFLRLRKPTQNAISSPDDDDDHLAINNNTMYRQRSLPVRMNCAKSSEGGISKTTTLRRVIFIWPILTPVHIVFYLQFAFISNKLYENNMRMAKLHYYHTRIET